MPRKLRIEFCGYHHVYNRGVAKGNVFLDEQDKVKFIEFMALVSKEYKFNIHSFCLMNNHYHILVENKKENLSQGMRQLNSQYASYFNKRYGRTGHLWQGRYNSWYVMDEKYLFTLFRYIESNPLKAKLSERIGEYKYCASYGILKDAIPPFLQNSFVLRDFNASEFFSAIEVSITKEELEKIDAFHKRRFKLQDEDMVEIKREKLPNHFLHVKSKLDRNSAIQKAYEDGYSKSDIARELSLSVAGVSKIIKKLKV
ncbi:MAG: transposase [Sulfurospirillaceae bacterium]|nr:transposase [Sulfurospirillaceae bacterium]